MVLFHRSGGMRSDTAKSLKWRGKILLQVLALFIHCVKLGILTTPTAHIYLTGYSENIAGPRKC